MTNGSEAPPTTGLPSEVLIAGAGGMLGTALQGVAAERGIICRAYSRAELDITDERPVRTTLADFAAHLRRRGVQGAVLNAAAYTDVEGAEDDPERAYLVNKTGARLLATAAQEEGVGFVHVSTDFVFDGENDAPYNEDDPPNPLNAYGASKLAGERAVMTANPRALVVRTAWVYGPGGTNFPMKIVAAARRALKAGAMRETLDGTPTLSVVTDQIGSPTYTVDLAGGLLDLLALGAGGLFHLAGGGSCSRYQWALDTLRFAGIGVPAQIVLDPVVSDGYSAKLRRPRNSVLDCARANALGVTLPAWLDGLARFWTVELARSES